MKRPTHVQPVAIECAYAEGIRFERCRLAHLNNSGIGFGPGCRRNAVIGCVIEDIGGNGVMVGWRGAGRLQGGAEGTLDADWADPADAPAGNEVANCVIRRCGADSRGAVGVFVAFSADTRVAHNVIHDLPYTGVSIGYRWNTTPTSQVRCVAEYNHIYDVMKTLADGGGIYTLGFQPGTVLRGNLIHDVHRSAYAHGGAPNNGFFIDEGSKGFLFESNVVHATSGESVRFNQCQRESRFSGSPKRSPASDSRAGRAMLNERVAKVVEIGLRRSGPSKAFGLAVLAALPAASVKAGTFGTATAAAKGSGAFPGVALLSAVGSVASVVGSVLGGLVGLWGRVQNTRSARERIFARRTVWGLLAWTVIFLVAYQRLFILRVLRGSAQPADVLTWTLFWLGFLGPLFFSLDLAQPPATTDSD